MEAHGVLQAHPHLHMLVDAQDHMVSDAARIAATVQYPIRSCQLLLFGYAIGELDIGSLCTPLQLVFSYSRPGPVRCPRQALLDQPHVLKFAVLFTLFLSDRRPTRVASVILGPDR